MRKRLVLIVCVALALVLGGLGASSALAAAKPKAVVLVDASGSMDGFFAKGQLKASVEELTKSLKKAGYEPEVYLFSTRYTRGSAPGKRLTSMAPLGDIHSAVGHTPSAKALARAMAIKGVKNIWLVTDNVPYAGGSSVDKDLNKFYSMLKDKRFAVIDLFPMSLDFEGRIFGRHADLLSKKWRGKRGLIAYSLVVGNADRYSPDRMRYKRAITDVSEDGSPFFLSQDHLRVRPLLEAAAKKAEFFEVAEAKVAEGSVPLKLVSSNEEKGQYTFAFPDAFPASTAIDGTIGLRLVSEKTPVRLKDVKIDIKSSPQYEVSDFESEETSVVPTPATVSMGGVRGDSKEVLVRISIPDGINFKPDAKTAVEKYKSYLKSAGSSDSTAALTAKLVVSLTPPPEKASLDTEWLQAWTVNPKDGNRLFGKPIDAQAQSRIYDLDGLYKRLGKQEDEKAVPTEAGANIDLELQFPVLGPLMAALAPILSLLLLGGGSAAYLGWRKTVVASRNPAGEWVIGSPKANAASAADAGWSSLGAPGMSTQDVSDGHYVRSRVALMTRGIPLSDAGSVNGWLKWVPLAGWVVVPAAGYALARGAKQAKLGTSLSSPSRVTIEKTQAAVAAGPSVAVDWGTPGSASVNTEWPSAAPVAPVVPVSSEAMPAAASSPSAPMPSPAGPAAPDTGSSNEPSGSDAGGSFISW